MRLRDISELVRAHIESDPERIFGGEIVHALVQDIQQVHIVYRPISSSGKKAGTVPWLVFNFQPFDGLIEPYNIYPGRFWAMQRIQRQPSGLPELVTHVERDLPGTHNPIAPDLYTSFSHSPKVESIIKRTSKDPAALSFYHRGNLMEPDRSTLPAEQCLPEIGLALPEGYPEDGIPGLVDLDGTQVIYLGELVFYNNFRTPDRAKLGNFLLNAVAVATVSRYVRQIVKKGISAAG